MQIRLVFASSGVAKGGHIMLTSSRFSSGQIIWLGVHERLDQLCRARHPAEDPSLFAAGSVNWSVGLWVSRCTPLSGRAGVQGEAKIRQIFKGCIDAVSTCYHAAFHMQF
jgi:hypothetical protein